MAKMGSDHVMGRSGCGQRWPVCWSLNGYLVLILRTSKWQGHRLFSPFYFCYHFFSLRVSLPVKNSIYVAIVGGETSDICRAKIIYRLLCLSTRAHVWRHNVHAMLHATATRQCRRNTHLQSHNVLYSLFLPRFRSLGIGVLPRFYAFIWLWGKFNGVTWVNKASAKFTYSNKV